MDRGVFDALPDIKVGQEPPSSKDPTLEMVHRGVIDDLPDILNTPYYLEKTCFVNISAKSQLIFIL